MGSQLPLSSGALTPFSTWGEFNNIAFAVQQAILKMQTVTLVRVESCTNDGGLSPVGFVNVTPLVNQVDGNGNPTPHTTIYNVPYQRLQGGSNAVIIDPVAGDIGIGLFASRDLTKVISTRAQANPGSGRRYSFSDALYVGGLLNGVPTQYVRFSASGVEIVSPNTVTITAPQIELNGDVTMSQSLTVAEDVTANGTSVHTHTHRSNAANPTPLTSVPLPIP